MRAGGKDQPSRSDYLVAAVAQHGDLIRCEAAPDGYAGRHRDTRRMRFGVQGIAGAELGIRLLCDVARRERLEVLPARRVAFLQHEHIRTRTPGGDGGGEPGGSGPDDEDITCDVLRPRIHGIRKRRGGAMRALHHHAVLGLHHAGALARAAVHRHDAVEAGAHAAPQAAFRARHGAA